MSGRAVEAQTYDVTVIGAGPAGSAASRKAAQLGLKTLLLEKEKMPRQKLCGGGITPKALRLLDFEIPRDIIESVVATVRIHVGQQCFKFRSTNPLVYMTSREKFDTFLTKKAAEAGVEIKDGTLVRNIVTQASFVEVQTRDRSFETKLVIGCDGTGGPTARATGLYSHWDPAEVTYAIESEVPVGQDGVRKFTGNDGCFDVYFGVSPAGYGWIFPKDDHLTVGVGCRMSRLKDGQKLFDNFVESIPELEGRNIPRPKAHLIPLGGAVHVPILTDRVLLAGDSAGFAEPLLGEGISFAISSGQIAAEVAEEACRANRFDADFLTVYKRRCERAFIADFAAAYRLARASYLENYDMDRLGTFFFSNRRFHESMIGVMDGTIRYRDVPRRLAWLYLKYRLAKLGLPIRT